jgi:Phosphoesterase family/Putative Ig domain
MRTTVARSAAQGLLALVLIILASIAWPASSVASTPLGANLIVNPGAETGAAGSGSGNPPPSWTTSGDFTQILYSTGNGYPTQSSPGPSNRGNAFFGGGYASSSTATQTISIGDLASEIDASKITYNVSGWLGGYANQDDNMKLVATFRSSSGGSLGTAQIGPVLAAERNNETGFLLRSKTAAVPVGTRSIRLVATATRKVGSSNDGYADNLSLELNSSGKTNTVTVTNPGSQTGTVGTPVSLQIQASDSASGQTLTYAATGLPAGLSINSATGLISGTPTTTGTSSVTVTATDTTKASGSASFSWTISSGSQSGNLIVDGDAESATCSLSGYEETTSPGWTITSGGPNAVCFNNTGGFPNSSVPGAQPGSAYFTGGTRGNSSLSQTVDVSAAASAIDAGTATYNLSGWLGGYGSQNDRVALLATFLSASGGSLGSSQIGPVTNTDRGNVTEFLQRTATGSIPAGTRSVRLDLNFTWTAGETTDGYADNLSLTISPSISAPTLTVPTSTVPGYDHVFLVYMENNNYSAMSNTLDGGAGIIGNSQAPYINGLASSNTLLSNYSAITHNSDPNYVAIAGGGTFGHTAGSGGLTSNCITTCTFNVPSLGDRVDAAGKTWKQYAEGANGNCDTSQHGYYYPDDVPFYYFPTMKNSLSYCQAHWQPLTQMFTDLQSTSSTPNFVWFDADDCNDMEACGISAGDTWLSNTLPKLFSSPAWTTQRSLLIITWDEDGNNLPGGFGNGQTNQVATIVIGSQNTVKTGYQSTLRYDHYSSARTIEQALGLAPLTSNDKYATPFNDVFN